MGLFGRVEGKHVVHFSFKVDGADGDFVLVNDGPGRRQNRRVI